MPKRSPELQVLERFAGTWEHELTIKPAGAEASTINTVDYRFWSRGERILHFSNPTDDPEFHMSLTYDPESKTYPGVMLIGSRRATVKLIHSEWNRLRIDQAVQIQVYIRPGATKTEREISRDA